MKNKKNQKPKLQLYFCYLTNKSATSQIKFIPMRSGILVIKL